MVQPQEQQVNNETQVPEGLQVAYDSNGKAHYFPTDFSQEKIGGIFSEMQIDTIPQELPPQELPTAGEAPNWLQRNADVPASISGSLAGAAYGSRFSPAGTLVGATIGGAVGTFGGSLYSSNVQTGQADYDKAIADTLIGLGVDLTTGLVGKLIPDQAWSKAMNSLGIKPEQAAKMILEKSGTKESLQLTQQFLESKGLSLTAYQTGQAGFIRKAQERLAGFSLFSQSAMGDYHTEVQKVIREEMNEAFNLPKASGATDLGARMIGAIDAGKQALNQYYSTSLDTILTKINKGYTTAAPLKLAMTNILERNGIRGLVADVDTGEISERVIKSDLTDDAKAFIQKEFSDFENLVALDAKAIIQLEKKLTQKQRELRNANNFTAADDIERVGEELKSVYAKMLTDIDPVYGAKYASLKDNYKSAVRNLMPEINKNVVDKALRSGDPVGLGELLLERGTVKQVQAFMNSIHSVYALARKQGTLDELPFKTPEEMRRNIRSAYLANKFPEFLDDAADLSSKKVIGKVDKILNNPDINTKFKAMFGKDYPNAIKILTAIKNTAKTPSGDVGTLMYRSSEYANLRNIIALGGIPTASYTVEGLGVALASLGMSSAFLYTPVMLKKAVTNPKLANRLLSLSSTKFENDKAYFKAAGMVMNDFLNALDDGEQTALSDFVEAKIVEGRNELYDYVNSIGVQ